MMARDMFSKKQWERDDNDADRRCKDCIDDGVSVRQAPVFGASPTVQVTLEQIGMATAAANANANATTATATTTTTPATATANATTATTATATANANATITANTTTATTANATTATTATATANATEWPSRWPAWRLPKMTDSLLHPTALNLRSILIALHAQYEPWLLGDMVRRSPGKGASSDGTFRLMMRTRTDGKVLLLIIGDDHTVIAWYVCRSESWKELQPGLLFLRARLEHLGTLHLLCWWWSDRCCDGANDVKKHLLVTIFPFIRRAPYRDCFHAINAVNKTGHEGMPEEKAELGSALFSALREIPETELEAPIAWLQRSRHLDRSKARAVALADFRKDGIIRNRSFGSEQQVKQWRAVRAQWAARKKLAQERRERCVIRTKSGTQQGTLEEMDAVLPCIEKGCLCDPMPMKEMYIETRTQPRTLLKERLRQGDTNRNEVRHRLLNEIVEHVARMGADLMHVELDFKLFLTNRSYDALFGRIDAHSLGCFPWDDEALNALGVDVLEGPPLFPRAVAPCNALPKLVPIRKGDERWEPLGFRYLTYLRDLKDETVVQEAMAAAEAALAVEAAAEVAAQTAEAATAEVMATMAQMTVDNVINGGDHEMDVSFDDDEMDAGMATAATSPAVATAPFAQPPTSPSPHSLAAAPQGALASPPRRALASPLATSPPGAATASPPGTAPTTAASPSSATRRQGALTFSGQQKTMHVTPALTQVIDPTSEAELQFMAEAMTQAIRHDGLGCASMAMYDRAADIYLERLFVTFKHPTRAPPDGLRYAKTSGERMKAVAEACTRRAREAERERTHRGADSDQPADPDSAAATAIVALITAAGGDAADVGALVSPALVMDAAALQADVTDVDARGSRKRAGAARRQQTYESGVKVAAITVTLAQLEDYDYSLSKPLMRRVVGVAKALNAPLPEGEKLNVRTTQEYSLRDQRNAVIAAMKLVGRVELSVPSQSGVASSCERE
jgi:hypothetical protein